MHVFPALALKWPLHSLPRNAWLLNARVLWRGLISMLQDLRLTRGLTLDCTRSFKLIATSNRLWTLQRFDRSQTLWVWDGGKCVYVQGFEILVYVVSWKNWAITTLASDVGWLCCFGKRKCWEMKKRWELTVNRTIKLNCPSLAHTHALS